MFGFGQDIGIDLGTATVIAYVKGKGIVLREPSVVAVDSNTGEVLAVGKEARRMLGRTPGNIVATRPLREGVISNYTVTEKMLKYFINKVCGRFVFAPRIMICVPSRVTEVEKKAVIDAATQAGARKVYLIEEPIAAAIGSSIKYTFLAPASVAASITAFFSTSVTLDGIHIIILGANKFLPPTLFIKYFIIFSVTV